MTPIIALQAACRCARTSLLPLTLLLIASLDLAPFRATANPPLPPAGAPPPFARAGVTGTPNDDWSRAMAVDAAGNTYVTGSFDGTATFGTITLSSSGGGNRPDIFVCKYDPAGTLVWVRRIGGTGTDTARGITLDPSNNVIITGTSDSVPLTVDTTSLSVSGEKMLFVKFSNAGTLLWARTSLPQAFFPPPNGTGVAVGADSAGNLYFTGQFTGPINFGGTAGIFPPPTGGIAFTNSAETDVYLLKYTPDGAIVWGRQIGGVNLQEVRGLAVTPAGDIYLAGRFNGTANFGSTNLTSGNTSFDTDAFLGRWDKDGNLAWVRRLASDDTDHGLAVAVDASGAPHMALTLKGRVYTIGSTTVTNNDLSYDLLLAKFSPAGTPLWEMSVQRPDTLPDEGFAIAIDPSGNLLATGHAMPGTLFKTTPFPSGSGHLFVTLIENGDPVWVKRAGTLSGDFGTGIGTDATGTIHVSGTLGRSEPGTLAVFDSFTPATFGQRDLFLASIAGSLPPVGPSMAFTLSGTSLVISWPLAQADYQLECSTSLGGAFGPAPDPRATNAVNQTVTVTILPAGPQKFYRLTRP